MMKNTLLLSLYLLMVMFTEGAIAETNDAKTISDVAARVELLRQAMMSADAKQLKELTTTELNYGHSGGHVENQAEFVEKIVSGKSTFVTIELQNQHIQIMQDIAIVRHALVATTNDNGQPGEVNIGVMQVWKKQHGQWRMFARQAFKTH